MMRFFFHHRFRSNNLFKIIQNELSYWNFVVLFFIVVFKYLHENRTIRYTKFFFFFFKKINFLVRIEKFRLIEDNVAIIIYVVFLWISNLKNIDKIIFYQIFDERLKLYFFIFLNAFICFKSENALQLNILRWTILFRINFFSNFCMKINDEFQLNDDDDVRFNMCATTKSHSE
jgi:hypothetical protein